MLPFTELGLGRQGQLKIKWGSEMGLVTPMSEREMKQFTTLMQNASPYLEVPTLIVEEWCCTQGRTKPDSTASTQGCAPL